MVGYIHFMCILFWILQHILLIHSVSNFNWFQKIHTYSMQLDCSIAMLLVISRYKIWWWHVRTEHCMLEYIYCNIICQRLNEWMWIVWRQLMAHWWASFFTHRTSPFQSFQLVQCTKLKTLKIQLQMEKWH